jgi:hypothetical protein
MTEEQAAALLKELKRFNDILLHVAQLYDMVEVRKAVGASRRQSVSVENLQVLPERRDPEQ